MRMKVSIAVLLICGLAVAGWVESEAVRAPGGRSTRTDAGQRRAPQAAQIEPQELLENFDKIVELIWTDEEEDAWKNARTY
jgi:hypothetical protein